MLIYRNANDFFLKLIAFGIFSFQYKSENNFISSELISNFFNIKLRLELTSQKIHLVRGQFYKLLIIIFFNDINHYVVIWWVLCWKIDWGRHAFSVCIENFFNWYHFFYFAKLYINYKNLWNLVKILYFRCC